MKAQHLVFIAILALPFFNAQANMDWDEDSALAVLTTGVEQKAQACQALARVGGPKSVPVLASLLGDEQLASYARTVLEVIKDPSAGEALVAALPNVNGRLLAGVVTSIGVRGEVAAIPALQELTAHPDRIVADAALTALGRIGTEDALARVTKVLSNAPDYLRMDAAHALLLAAELKAEAGDKKTAKALKNTILNADLPDYIKQAVSVN
jgi:HEAT repeat protein